MAEGDVLTLNRYIEKRTNIPTPVVPDSRYVFNPSRQVSSGLPRQEDE